MRQEQEPATEEITEVGPGVLRLQLPISMPGLGHVNCYALEDERGVALVDPGLPGPDSYRALTARLAQAGYPAGPGPHRHRDPQPPRPLRRRRTAAGRDGRRRRHPPLVQHVVGPAEPTDVDVERGRCAATIAARRRGTTDAVAATSGAPSRGMTSLRGAAGAHCPRPQPSVHVDDADVITLARREWVAVHTPGPHPRPPLPVRPRPRASCSRATTCCPRSRRTSPGMRHRRRPAARSSSTRSTAWPTCEGVTVVLPAHGHPFARPRRAGRGHQGPPRRAARAAAQGARPSSAGRRRCRSCCHAPVLARGRRGRWPTSETYAHLEHLRLAGHAKVTSVDGRLEYIVD